MNVLGNQIRLILAKDIRRLRWALLVVAALLLVGAWMDLYDPWAFESSTSKVDYVSPYPASALMQGLLFLTCTVVLGLLVQQDALIGTHAYWKTRPVRPLALIGAKATFALTFLALAPAIVDVAILARYGLEPSRWIPTLLSIVFGLAFYLAFSAAIAAVTPNFPLYLLASIAAYAAWLMVSVVVLTLSGPSDSAAVSILLWLSVLWCVVWWRHFRLVRPGRSLLMLAAGVLLAPLVALVPWHRIPRPSVAGQVQIRAEYEGVKAGYRGTPTVALLLFLADAKEGTFFVPRGMTGSLELDDQRVIAAHASSLGLAAPFDPRGLLQKSFPAYRWYGSLIGVSRTASPVQLSLATDLDQLALSRSRSFRGRVKLDEYAFDRLDSTAPLRNEELNGGQVRVEILDSRRTGWSLVVDQRVSTIVDPTFSTGASDMVLVDRQHRAVARPLKEPGSQSTDRRRTIVRAGGTVLLESRSVEFPLHPGAASDRLEDMELQLWRSVRQRRVTANIELRNLLNAK